VEDTEEHLPISNPTTRQKIANKSDKVRLTPGKKMKDSETVGSIKNS